MSGDGFWASVALALIAATVLGAVVLAWVLAS